MAATKFIRTYHLNHCDHVNDRSSSFGFMERGAFTSLSYLVAALVPSEESDCSSPMCHLWQKLMGLAGTKIQSTNRFGHHLTSVGSILKSYLFKLK